MNLLNQKFNFLKVIEKTPQRDQRGGIIWKCQCDCGNETFCSTVDLRSGHKKSCGCLQRKVASELGKKNLIDLTNQTFGLLKVNKKAYSKKTPNGSTQIYWECECSCGNKIIVRGESLKTGNTKSCGCVKSFGEQKISEILRKNNIQFEKEKIFQGSLFRYDFYVNDNYIIEYDGKQHFQDFSWGSNLCSKEQSQKRDKEKNEYCFQNNIPIIRIPYTHYLNLELKDLLLETSNFIITNEN